MRRYFLACGVLFGSIFGLAKADYIIIRYNAGMTVDKTGVTGAMPGAGGMMPGGGDGGPGAGGMMPPGMGGGMMPGGRGRQGPGAGGMMPPGGGGMMPGGGAGMMPPGGGGMMPGGGAGMMPPGGGGMSMPGAGGMGLGGAGMGPGGEGGIGGGFGFPGLDQDTNFTPLHAVGVVEVRGRKGVTLAPGLTFPIIIHKWGGEVMLAPPQGDQHLTVVELKMGTVAQRYTRKVNEVRKSGTKATPDEILSLADWALQHGMIAEVEKLLDEVGTVDAKHRIFLAYRKVRDALAAPITKPDLADQWRSGHLSEYKVERSEHYALLHNLGHGDDKGKAPAGVRSRLQKLEEHHKAFFYWFALRGEVLEVPTERLVSVLVLRREEFDRQHQIFDGASMVADGFVARRDNLAIYSLERTDPGAMAMREANKPLWAKFTVEEALRKAPRALANDVLARGHVQTIALLQKALEEDSEVSTVTHEGTRHLLAATNLLPRGVAAPEWLQFGMGSFFDTPRGSLWTTVGAPNSSVLPEYNYLAYFKLADKNKKIEPQRHLALRKIVTDTYFRDSLAKPHDVGLRLKARSMSWSLVYFLANKRLDGLLRYCQEMARLPRDLEFDADTLMNLFARCFDLLDPKNPSKIDSGRLATLADQWHNFIVFTPMANENLMKELKSQSELKASPTRPGGAGVGRPGGTP